MGSSNLLTIVGLLIMMMSSLLIVPAPVSAAGSRKALIGRSHHHRQKTKTTSSTSSGAGFRVELRHVDHGRNFSKFERLQRAVIRGKHRLQKLSMMGLAAATTGDTTITGIKSPIHPGNGEFLMKIAIGTPPLPYSAILDTGSDLIWTQCQPCLQCYDQPSPIFNPSNSSSFRRLPCSSALCSALPTPSCSSSSSSSCSYSYGYGDYSSTSGTLATDTFFFDDSVSVPGIAFGCGDDNEGSGFDQGGGLVGLGRGPLSLVSQLDEPKFSYCLTAATSYKSTTSTLLMGSLADITDHLNSDAAIRTTPLAKNPAQPSFYYLNLEGISVGGARVPIPKSTFALNDDGTGGVIIDSGTTITYLEEKAFEALKKEFVRKTKLAVSEDGAEKTGLELCFENPAGVEEVELPALVFHFERADLELPAENYMVGDEEDGVVCLAMGSASGMSIFGNIQQQNMVVLHDLGKETISFVGAKCEDL